MGHIFGVESSYMVEKLEQYNRVIEVIVAVWFSLLLVEVILKSK